MQSLSLRGPALLASRADGRRSKPSAQTHLAALGVRIPARKPSRQIPGRTQPLTILRASEKETVSDAHSSADTTQDAGQHGLIFQTGDSGSWDEAAVGNPVVGLSNIEGKTVWTMWYAGAEDDTPSLGAVAPMTGSIGVAVSNDGVNWMRGSESVSGGRSQSQRDWDVGKILEPNGEDWWWLDTCHLAPSDVQIFGDSTAGSGVHWMFYQGADYEQLKLPEGLCDKLGGSDVEGLRMRPGLAMSQDGKNWARIEGEHHTGALFDVGAEGEWDHLFIGHPQVVAAGPDDMRMYYHSYDVEEDRYRVGVAVSGNGFKWEKKGIIFEGGAGDASAFDARGAAARHVVRNPDNGDFVMFYEAVGADDKRTIGLATSKDGITNWERCKTPVLEPSGVEGAWDEGGVGTPRAVAMASSWRLYYAGRKKGEHKWTGIGLALSEEDGQTHNGISSAYKRRTGSS